MVTAHSLGVELVTLTQDPLALYLPFDEPERRAGVEQALDGLVSRYGGVGSSLLASIKAGKETEIDFISGYVANQALAGAVPAPLNTQITKMVHEIEAGERKVSVANLLPLFDL